MNKSESTAKIAAALCQVQGKLEGAAKSCENPFFKKKYVDLAATWDACRSLLTENDLAVVQTLGLADGKGVIVDTTLLHVSGEWIGGSLYLPATKEDPQAIGSAITYGRRYALAAIVGICPEDDDGESATGRGKTPTKKKTPPTPTKKPGKPAEKGKAASGNYEFLEIMGKQKKRVGDPAYYKVLGVHGFEHANEVGSRDIQVTIFKEIEALDGLKEGIDG